MKVGHLDPVPGVCPACGWRLFGLHHWLACVDPDVTFSEMVDVLNDPRRDAATTS